MNIHQKDWCWSWSSNTLAIWCEQLTYLKRPWCWARLKVGGEGDDRGWDGYMASPTQWTWVWAGSGSWRWTGRPGVLQSMWSQRVGHDWTELSWYTHHLVSKMISINLISFISHQLFPSQIILEQLPDIVCVNISMCIFSRYNHNTIITP